MPELPEVETIRLSLQPFLVGNRFIKVHLSGASLRSLAPAAEFDRWIVGHKIERIWRRGKYLIFDLENAAHLVLHLGMSGRLALLPHSAPLESHTHAIFIMESGRQLRFRDPRRFGSIEVITPEGPDIECRFRHLGVEPLGQAFTPDYLAQRMCGNRPIKNVVMDAGCVVGVGNIYANEALYLAGVRPDRAAKSIDANETAQIVAAIRTVLTLAIERGGTTLKDFRNTQGEPGFFQLDLRVYGRQGKACFACGTAIEKQRIGGRSSCYCPHCQR